MSAIARARRYIEPAMNAVVLEADRERAVHTADGTGALRADEERTERVAGGLGNGARVRDLTARALDEDRVEVLGRDADLELGVWRLASLDDELAVADSEAPGADACDFEERRARRIRRAITMTIFGEPLRQETFEELLGVVRNRVRGFARHFHSNISRRES